MCQDDANLRFAFIVWFFYSMVLCGKLALSFYTFVPILNTQDLWGINVYRLILTISCIIFLLLVLSHHYTKLSSPRQQYLSYLASSVTLDILDSIQFLNFLFDPKLKDRINTTMEILVLVFACINFVLPTFALMRLRYRKIPRWLPIHFNEFYTLLYFLIVNLPYLVLRVLIWQNIDSDVSTFIVKNVLMILLGLRELWIAVSAPL